MNYRILLVDQAGSGMQDMLGHTIWQECGFEITGRTPNADGAVTALQQYDFDMLLCIHRPAERTAVETLSRLQQKHIDAPAVVVSLEDDSVCMRQCFLYGALDFLIEPLRDEDIRHALQRATELLDRRLMNEEYNTALDYALSNLNGKNSAVMEKLREFMLTSREQTVTTESAAEFFGFNRDYFSRYFKRNTGAAFSEFHKDFMMEYARLLLSGGHFKVHEVSDILGFSSADYFSRIFKRRTGRSPSEFRKPGNPGDAGNSG